MASLHDIDLEPVGHLLGSAAPVVAVLFVDVDGEPVWQQQAPDVDVLPGLVEARARYGPRPGQWSLDRGQLVIEQPLVDTYAGTVGALLVVVSGDEAGVDVALRVAAAAACAAQLAVQSGELEEMAQEIAARYEELNLLYTLEERRDVYDPASGHAALRQMVADCSVFLDVGMSCLYAPAENLDICIMGDDTGELGASWVGLRERLLVFVNERNVATVVNDAADQRVAGLAGRLPGKLLLVPLRHQSGRVCGLLCAINPDRRADFSNSDRKLFETLGEQASRIIQRSYDAVTGLLNRHGFGRRAVELLAAHRGESVAVMHLNLDSMAMVNDGAGRHAGDAVLRRVAAMLSSWAPIDGVVGHLGDDDFVMLFAGVERLNEVHLHAHCLQSALAAESFSFDGKRFDISACVGIATEVADADGLTTLLTCAEAACRVAKRYGRSQTRIYDPHDEQYQDHQRQAAWGPRIIEALGGEEFVLYAQPMVPLDDRVAPPHYEVLVRLPESDGRVIPPGAFMPAAERYGLMPRLDRLVLSMTVDFMRLHADDDFVLAVNISGQSLADGEYLRHVLDTVSVAGVPFQRLCFEVTETAAIADFDSAVRFIDAVQTRGSRVALDDFGSGLSSFGYLRRLSVDYLKIDGQIVRAIVEDPINAVMVESIHRIARVMGISTIAEFVESEAVMQRLRGIGVDFAQGYGIARPAPIEETVAAGAAVRARLPVRAVGR